MKKRTFRIICACTIFLPVFIIIYTIVLLFLLITVLAYPFAESGDGEEEMKIDNWEEIKELFMLPISNYINTGYFTENSENDTPWDSDRG